MVTKKQIKRLKDKLKPDKNQVDEVKIFLVNDDGTYEDIEGNIITEEEYKELPGIELN